MAGTKGEQIESRTIAVGPGFVSQFALLGDGDGVLHGGAGGFEGGAGGRLAKASFRVGGQVARQHRATLRTWLHIRYRCRQARQ